MIRQIFIAPVKEGVTEEAVQTRIAEMRKLKEHIPGIVSITVDKALGLYGVSNAVVMNMDLRDMDAWNALLADEYHTWLGNTAGQYFNTDGFIAAQLNV
ncbi:Dabb family protein [Enterocloster bolteae]|uniref:Dabb family protein n=1 Tax=Enterocloster bolteae TaxID=208479 RepID=UPI0028DCE4BC|nr:Dabb family protein [Enterocloster bolteae]